MAGWTGFTDEDLINIKSLPCKCFFLFINLHASEVLILILIIIIIMVIFKCYLSGELIALS